MLDDIQQRSALRLILRNQSQRRGSGSSSSLVDSSGNPRTILDTQTGSATIGTPAELLVISGLPGTAVITQAEIVAGSTHGTLTITGSSRTLTYDADPTDDAIVSIDFSVTDGDQQLAGSINVTTTLPANWIVVDAAQAASVGGVPDGSREQPFAEFNAASIVASDGDVITVAGGQTYDPSLTAVDMTTIGAGLDGTRGMWILHDLANVTVRAHATTSGPPVVNGANTYPTYNSGTFPDGTHYGLIDVSHCRSTTIQDIELRDSNQTGLAIRNINGTDPNTDGVTVQGVYVNGTQTYGIIATEQNHGIGLTGQRPQNIIVEHCKIKDACKGANSATLLADVPLGEAARFHRCDNITFQYNEVSGCCKEGPNTISTTNATVRRNYIHSPNTSGAYRATLGLGNCLYVDGSNYGSANVTVEQNVCLGDRRGIQLADEVGTASSGYGLDGVLVKNNIVADISGAAVLATFTAGQSAKFRDIDIYNNTLESLGSSSPITFGEPTNGLTAAQQYENAEMKRNIIITPIGPEYVVTDSGTTMETQLASGAADNIVERVGGGAVTLYGSGSDSTTDMDLKTIVLTNFFPVYTGAAWSSRTIPEVDVAINSGSPAVEAGSALVADDLLGASRTDATRGALLP